MELTTTLNPMGGPGGGSYVRVNLSHLGADKAEPGSRLQKLSKAAQDFEGVLLSSWLEEAQKSSLNPSDADLDSGSETIRSLGTQAVAQALAERGGLGIARMIVDHFRDAVGGASGGK
jgi:Rod binding domain-containing protein